MRYGKQASVGFLALLAIVLGAWFPHSTGVVAPPAPTVTSISPTGGTTAGGTVITIAGTGYGSGGSAVTGVNFGSFNAAAFTCTSTISCGATSPAASAGTVDVTVVTAAGTSAVNSGDQFVYSGSSCSPVYAAPGPGTTYYVKNGGNDSLSGLNDANAWASINKVNTFGGYGSGAVTINFRNCDTFVALANSGLNCPAGVSSALLQGYQPAAFTSQSITGLTIPVIQANNRPGNGLLTFASNCTVQGLYLNGDGGLTPYGVLMGSVNNVTFCGSVVTGFYSPGKSDVDSEIAFNGNPTNVYIGGCLSSDARTGNYDNIIGGSAGPTSPDDNGIVMFGSNDPGPVFIQGNLIQNIGSKSDTTGGAVSQVGLGIHLSGISTGTYTALTYTGGTPNNQLATISGNVIQYVGLNYNQCGGASGIETGSSDRIVIQDNWIFFVSGAYGSCDNDGIDPDIGSTNILVQRNFTYGNRGPGLEAFCSPPWGPVIFRYNVVVDNGENIPQGNWNPQFHGSVCNMAWYGNTFVSSAAGVGGQSKNLNMVGVGSSSVALFANNIVASAYPYWTVWSDATASAGVNFTTNVWDGSGAGGGFGGFTWPDGANYTTYTAWKAAGGGSDQNGLAVDPLFVGGPNSSASSFALSTVASPAYRTGLNLTTCGCGPGGANFDVGDKDFYGHTVVGATTPNIGADAYGSP